MGLQRGRCASDGQLGRSRWGNTDPSGRTHQPVFLLLHPQMTSSDKHPFDRREHGKQSNARNVICC